MQEGILSLAKKLISLPSVDGNEKALSAVLDVAREALEGFRIEEYRSEGVKSILVSNAAENTKHFKLILNAHLDVVPGKDEQYIPYENDGKLYGRGAYDMKAAAAVMILVFKEIARKVQYPLALQIVTDEEIGGFNGTKYQLDKGITADFVIAGENTDLKIINMAKGILRVKIKAEGKASHGAYPWKGENAVLKLISAIDEILKVYPLPEEESWTTTVNVAWIETANRALNSVPDSAEAYLDIRYIPQDKDVVLENIRKAAAKTAKAEVIISQPHQYTKEDNGYIDQLSGQIKKFIKKDSKIVACHGASDVRFYEAMDIPSVCFGPVGSGQHSDKESVDIQNLEDYYSILKEFVLALK